MAETQRTSTAEQASTDVTVGQDEFFRLMNRAIRPKSDEARTAVEEAVRTLAAQALDQSQLISGDALESIKAIIAELDLLST